MSNVSHHQELNDMRTLLPLLLALSTSGCAVTSTEVNVALARVGTRSAIRVEDVRLNKQLYMSAIALGGQASTYPLTPSPPLDIALMERLAAGASWDLVHSASPGAAIMASSHSCFCMVISIFSAPL